DELSQVDQPGRAPAVRPEKRNQCARILPSDPAGRDRKIRNVRMTLSKGRKMRLNVCATAPLVVVFSLALCVPTRAASDDDRAREAGPEDGFLCCNGLIPFLFHGDEVLTTTGRAGIFRSGNRGERWQRSMKGLVAPNGVAGFVNSLCQAPSEPRIVYALAGLS